MTVIPFPFHLDQHATTASRLKALTEDGAPARALGMIDVVIELLAAPDDDLSRRLAVMRDPAGRQLLDDLLDELRQAAVTLDVTLRGVTSLCACLQGAMVKLPNT